MRKDLSNKNEWCKHTKNCWGGRRMINKANRRNAKKAINREMIEGKSRLAGAESL